MNVTKQVEPLLTIDQAREALGGIGNSTFYALVADGSLPLVKVRRRSFVRASDISAYIEQHVGYAAGVARAAV